jgi:peptidoglycan/xylan/chitin deacetylase (PgdA/CDA1 family)
VRTYTYRANTIMRKIWPKYIWNTTTKGAVYLTFDDGPHPTITPFVLHLLKNYNAKATFFCIGKNVQLYPTIYSQLQEDGHRIGNHTHNHLNGWKNKNKAYIKNVLQAERCINSKLFRPPYGRIKGKQAAFLIKRGYKIVMWSLLTGDFDINLSPEQCWGDMQKNIKEGDIIVFHDSEKAWERLRYCLPKLLEYCKNNNLQVLSLPF